MTSSESGADDTSASTATLPPYRQKMVDEQLDEYADVDNDDDADVEVEFTATTAEDDVSTRWTTHMFQRLQWRSTPVHRAT